MMNKSLFDEGFLEAEMDGFRASSIVGIRKITNEINDWVSKLDSGRLQNTKEESIKSQFVTSFFGDILGYNYGNANYWQLEEEKKSVSDGTKPDCALGYFTKENSKVLVVIECKDANHDLDKKQTRTTDKRTPVEQAFSYVPKSGGYCKWVVVTNFIETRFYSSNDDSKYQVYFLKDLLDEQKRNEMLFLFHKDFLLIKEGKSITDLRLEKQKRFEVEEVRPLHIIDKIHNCVKRFEGLGFVDPNYLASLPPFNILDDHVWHYHNQELFTLNRDIYNLLEGISIEENEILFSDSLQNEITVFGVIEAKEKLKDVFKFLNHSMITQIAALKDYRAIEERNKNTIGFVIRRPFFFKEGEEGIRKSIHILPSVKCDCLSCNFRSLDFNHFLRKLKTAEGNLEFHTPEYAYGNYLAASNNFKSTYSILKTLEQESKGIEGKEVTYFLTKYNIKYLQNLLYSYYQYDDIDELLRDIKSVDLDRVIYSEIEFHVEEEIKNYLVDVKEDKLIYKIQDEIQETIEKINKLKKVYDNGGSQQWGPDLISKLSQSYFKLYLHINRNYLIYDRYKRYIDITAKVFQGLITSYRTKEKGLKKINEFFLTEAILHISSKELKEILSPIEYLAVEDGCIESILLKLKSFTSSYFKDSLFGEPYKNELLSEYLNSMRFEEAFTNIFSNLFTVLAKIDITKEQLQGSKTSLVKFLEIETVLASNDLERFSFFLWRKGILFEKDELRKLLEIGINRDSFGYNKYCDYIRKLCWTIDKHYPEFELDNKRLIQSALLNCISDNGVSVNYQHIIPLTKICSENCKQFLINAFEEELEKKFSIELYEAMLRQADYSWDYKNYFRQYSQHVNEIKGQGYKYGELELTDLVFINYILIVYSLNIDFEECSLKSFANLNDFETWLINPINFDYTIFNVKWLLDVNKPIILCKIKEVKEIKNAIDLELLNNFAASLADIK